MRWGPPWSSNGRETFAPSRTWWAAVPSIYRGSGPTIPPWPSVSRKASSSAAASIPETRWSATFAGGRRRPSEQHRPLLRSRRHGERRAQYFPAYRRAFSGNTDPRSAGNGSLMRLAPVPLYFLSDPREAVRLSAESSHQRPAWTPVVTSADSWWEHVWAWTRTFCLATVTLPSKDSGRRSPFVPRSTRWPPALSNAGNPPEIVGSGYVVRSLEAALGPSSAPGVSVRLPTGRQPG